MRGTEFRDIRRSFGLNKAKWMYALGYAGNENTMTINCKRYENGERLIPLYLAQYVWLLHEVAKERVGDGLPPMPIWPEWPAYYEDEEAQ